MKYALFLFTLIALFSGACQDKKESSKAPEKTIQDTINDSINKVSEPKKKEPQSKYPLITQNNVVSFLTEYGKNNPETQVRMITQLGEIRIELFTDTPIHRANFVYLVKQNYFNETFFHRVVPNFIIQGGNSDHVSTSKKRNKLGPNYLLPAELSNRRIHTYGTVSGAKEYRENPDKQTAPYEFFIFLGPDKNAAHLNGDYTIFGKVIQGMDVVEKIANLPTDEGEWPKQNVFITAEIIR